MTYILYVQILLLDVEYASGNMGNSGSQRSNFKLALAWTPALRFIRRSSKLNLQINTRVNLCNTEFLVFITCWLKCKQKCNCNNIAILKVSDLIMWPQMKWVNTGHQICMWSDFGACTILLLRTPAIKANSRHVSTSLFQSRLSVKIFVKYSGRPKFLKHNIIAINWMEPPTYPHTNFLTNFAVVYR